MGRGGLPAWRNAPPLNALRSRRRFFVPAALCPDFSPWQAVAQRSDHGRVAQQRPRARLLSHEALLLEGGFDPCQVERAPGNNHTAIGIEGFTDRIEETAVAQRQDVVARRGEKRFCVPAYCKCA